MSRALPTRWTCLGRFWLASRLIAPGLLPATRPWSKQQATLRDAPSSVRLKRGLMLVGLAISACPWAGAAPGPVLSTANALGMRNTGTTLATVSASGSLTYHSPLNLYDSVASGTVTVDPASRQVHELQTLSVTHSVCGVMSCQAGGSGITGVGGVIQDVVNAYSPSVAIGSPINVYFNPVAYRGTVSFSNVSGFEFGSVAIVLQVAATVPSDVPGAPVIASATDITPKTYSVATGLGGSTSIVGQSNGMVLRMPNGASYNFTLSFGYSQQFAQVGIPAGGPAMASGTMLADFSHTLDWGGIAGVTDGSTGRILNDVQLTSSMGANWQLSGTSPVPEPATLPMGLAGLGLLLIRCRRWA